MRTFNQVQKAIKYQGWWILADWFSMILTKSGVLRARPRMEKHLSRVWSRRESRFAMWHGRVCVWGGGVHTHMCLMGHVNKVEVAYAGHGTVERVTFGENFEKFRRIFFRGMGWENWRKTLCLVKTSSLCLGSAEEHVETLQRRVF